MANAHPLVRVGKVPFGKGLFARRAIAKGEIIGAVAGKVINDPEYASAYCIDLGQGLSLEPRAPFRYLNHCCEPNSSLFSYECEFDDGSTAPAEIQVEALQDIPEGAELTIDYAWSAHGAIKCLCGAATCRGWVVDIDELPALLKQKAPKTRKPKAAPSLPSAARRTAGAEKAAKKTR